jgi:predicted RNA-binding protein YlxR (DUF448 family)
MASKGKSGKAKSGKAGPGLPGRRKHIPQRTCIVCRQVQDKRDLVRLVRTPDGELVIDETGKRNGRGAYLCRQSACWEAALKGSQVAKALKMEIRDREKEMLDLWSRTHL